MCNLRLTGIHSSLLKNGNFKNVAFLLEKSVYIVLIMLLFTKSSGGRQIKGAFLLEKSAHLSRVIHLPDTDPFLPVSSNSMILNVLRCTRMH